MLKVGGHFVFRVSTWNLDPPDLIAPMKKALISLVAWKKIWKKQRYDHAVNPILVGAGKFTHPTWIGLKARLYLCLFHKKVHYGKCWISAAILFFQFRPETWIHEI